MITRLLPTVETPRSRLTVIERPGFDIRRVYYLHTIDPAVARAGHAHRKLRRLMIAVAGGFKATLDGAEVRLERPDLALEIPPMTWLEVTDFTKDAVVMIIASEEHDEADCIRDYDEFLKERA